ncbi:restriction endonuclease subunit S [Bifidobacterium adolescentis]|uniref:restriction endonuclease subunit S n=1 Tax=Bifidobacterium adolescentis TaxID=1680 RepID=UPI001C37F300|nr:restriction endonuclease subunit S [Bifidobacterium adolescentis]MBV3806198.1 restriction endonuclease subunit S [Bifidobacterium adolescentis]
MAEQHGKTLVPQIRFAGFTDPWEQRKLGELSTEFKSGEFICADNVSESGSYPVYGGNGLRGYTTTFNHEGLYTLIGRQGALCGNVNIADGKSYFTEHAVAVKANHLNDTTFLYYLFGTLDLGQYSGQSAQPGLAVSNLVEVEAMVPDKAEQKKISRVFKTVDSLITLHQRKYDKLCVLKKSMLDKMFPKGGSLYPEIRFAGFTDPWEQRKLSELVEIERGGSPRPIERYITDDPCGLNWVKIGDAPELGRYITQTTEKIKPEGLAKTRQVYPGDLVLSNSMSFGRPYIMAIKGCIHDGWLLIRDAQKHFDPIFLCHMLGAPQMLNQYRMFAAGSTVNNLNKELVGKAIVSLPSKDEQREIGIVLDRLDSLITLHQRKLELLRNIKKSMLDKMFV